MKDDFPADGKHAPSVRKLVGEQADGHGSSVCAQTKKAYIVLIEQLFSGQTTAKTTGVTPVDISSSLQVLQHALEERNRILLRMRELAYLSASKDRVNRPALNLEFQKLSGELDAIAARADVIAAQKILSRTARPNTGLRK